MLRPQYNKHISLVPWHVVKFMFNCTTDHYGKTGFILVTGILVTGILVTDWLQQAMII